MALEDRAARGHRQASDRPTTRKDLPQNPGRPISTAFALVVASSVTHAFWNLVAKREGGGARFIGLSKITEVVLLLPVAILLTAGGGRALAPGATGALVLVVAAALTLGNYVALDRAYAHGDLSVVYPVSRAGALLVIPFLGLIALGERMNMVGWAGWLIILGGVLVIGWRASPVARPAGARWWSPGNGFLFAMIAALTAAGYTVWGKYASRSMSPFDYFFGYTALVAAAYAVHLLRRESPRALWDAWRRHWWPLVQVAACNSATTLMIVTALRTMTSSHVLAVRQLGIAVGAALGWWLLDEVMDGVRLAGVALLVTGTIILGLS